PRRRFSTGISAWAAASIAFAGAGLRCAMPAAMTRAIGCCELFPSFRAWSNSPFSTWSKISWNTSRDLSLLQNNIRSMVRAREIKEQSISGIMMIPPLTTTLITCVMANASILSSLQFRGARRRLPRLQRRPEGALVIKRDVQHAIAIMKVDGVSTAVAQRNRPSAFARFDSVHLTSKKPNVRRDPDERRALDS